VNAGPQGRDAGAIKLVNVRGATSHAHDQREGRPCDQRSGARGKRSVVRAQLHARNSGSARDREVVHGFERVSVIQALQEERRFVFEYDFGDGWEHEVVMEDLTWSYFGLKSAVCRDGENACPPDDVGGAYGYAQFLEAVANPEHEEHGRVLEWAGGSFDPTGFDLTNANALLQKVR
jgi:hypothetical protein